MSKSNKAQTARAVCKGSVAPSVSGRINAINEAASRLERLSQTGNFAPLPQLVGTIARNLNRNRQGECVVSRGNTQKRVLKVREN